MKTTYYLVLAAVVAAAGVTVFARLPDRDRPAPAVPLTASAGDVRRLELPPVALPPDDGPPDPMLIAPRGANLPLPLPVPPPSAPELPPVTPTAGALPPLPAVPELPKPVAPPALPEPPALPKVELPALPVPPAVPPVPKPDETPLPPLPALPKPEAPVLPPVVKPEVALPPVAPVPLPPAPKPEVPALPPVVKPEVPALPPVTTAPLPPAPKPEVALPPAVPPMVPFVPQPGPSPLPPVTPALPPVAKPEPPLVPMVPKGTVVPPMPVQPPAPKPDAPLPPVVQPEPPALQPLPRPQPLPPVTAPTSPSAPTGSLDPKPQPLPPRVEPQPVPVPAPGTKFVLLKGDRLLECSSAAPNGDVWVVRQGALDRALPKGEVQFVGDSRDAIYKFVLARVKPADAAARLQVARWCMYVGMREQALAEAHEVRKLDPKNGTAADMIRSLELSLKQFPPADEAKMSAPPQPVYPVDLRPAVPPMATPVAPVIPQPVAPPIPPANEPDLDVPAAAARAFPGFAMAVLQQKCAECHARGDYAGAFKLAAVDLENPSERAVRANLRASAAQLSKDGPHPLLEKARTAHGAMKNAAMAHTDAAYKSLSAWAASAETATTVKPIPPAATTGVPQLLPPVGTGAPALPPAVPVSKPVEPLLPPLPPPGDFGAALPPKPPVAPGTGDEFDPAGYNRELPKR